MQLWLPLLAVSAVALDTLPRDNSTTIIDATPAANATGLESAAGIPEEFGPEKWGIQRVSVRRPRVHGWDCDTANNNQYWKYRAWETYTMIEHKKWRGWCLANDNGFGYPWMERCNGDDNRVLWAFKG
uniref:Secreted protein n=1 Tax=Achlya hypogyna TaxID=1202772 RepID=A0A0A7CME7_ACHHY|nr:secreted protein [Achlya hypogyna]